MSDAALTSYAVDEQGVALLRLERAEARNAINTQMLVEMLEHLAVARGDEAVRVLVVSSSDHMGLSAGADVRSSSTTRARSAACSSSPTSTTRSPASRSRRRRLPRRRRRRRRRDRGRLRHAGRRLQPAHALPGRRARRPGRPGPPGHPLRPRRRQVPAASPRARSAPTRRCGWAWSTASPRPRAPRTRRWSSPPQVAAHPPEAVARLKRMLHEWDDVEGRSAREGEGQVEWARTGPGLPQPDQDQSVGSRSHRPGRRPGGRGCARLPGAASEPALLHEESRVSSAEFGLAPPVQQRQVQDDRDEPPSLEALDLRLRGRRGSASVSAGPAEPSSLPAHRPVAAARSWHRRGATGRGAGRGPFATRRPRRPARRSAGRPRAAPRFRRAEPTARRTEAGGLEPERLEGFDPAARFAALLRAERLAPLLWRQAW